MMIFYTKKKFMWIYTWIQKITLTNILRWVIVFLQIFYTNELFWT